MRSQVISFIGPQRTTYTLGSCASHSVKVAERSSGGFRGQLLHLSLRELIAVDLGLTA